MVKKPVLSNGKIIDGTAQAVARGFGPAKTKPNGRIDVATGFVVKISDEEAERIAEETREFREQLYA